MIDLYCERVGAGIWAEPLNVLSNIGFIVGAAVTAGTARADNRGDSMWLATLIFAIGCGSTAFHLFANTLTQWLDVIPIALFQVSFLALFLRRALAWTRSMTASAVLLFGLMTLAGNAHAEILNGSTGYLPSVLVLIALAANQQRRHRNAMTLWVASALLLVSLCLRTIDNWLCPLWPLGTHFGWHLLNAVMLCLVVVAYTRASHPSADSAYR